MLLSLKGSAGGLWGHEEGCATDFESIQRDRLSSQQDQKVSGGRMPSSNTVIDCNTTQCLVSSLHCMQLLYMPPHRDLLSSAHLSDKQFPLHHNMKGPDRLWQASAF